VTVSIKDIADRAKVSPSTVSRALNNHPRIGRKTKTTIVRLAQEMGYVPSAAARNLVERRSGTIGVCIPELSNPSFAMQTKGVEDAAAENGYQILVTPFYKDDTRELECVRDFQERRMDGIVIPGSSAYQAYLDPASNFFTPIVTINRPSFPYSVSTDRLEGARLLVRHLLELGHTRIVYIRAPDRESDESRLAGYQVALAERGIAFREEFLLEGNDRISGGIRAAELLLEIPGRPTAVFAFNDITAIGVIHGLRQLGCDVPRDYSVAGYDNLEIASHYHPTLTTVEQPNYELGRRAFRMLLALMKKEEPIAPLILPPELIIGDSTSPPSGAAETRGSGVPPIQASSSHMKGGNG
jgi:DNA-binding LacI/PurR family transcriptional regulator